MLPKPDFSLLQGEYVAPQSETELALVDIWAELLDIEADTISCTANFFELGGHSLLVIRLMAQLKTRFEVEVDIQKMLKANDLSDLGEIMDNLIMQNNVQADSDYQLADDEVEFEI
ncbi:MAG: hypothetical protein HRT35_28920, partial [Algicola sp.]|nr:hypothetical protein [Algicola sp.]